MSDPMAVQAVELGTDAVQAGEQLGGSTPSTPDAAHKGDKPRGLAQDAWRDLRRRPLFVIAAGLIVFFLAMALFPRLFTSVDPTAADLRKSLEGPQSGHPFGFDVQGYDVYARTIYGARTSIIVGTAAVLGNLLLGGLVGITAGYVGNWVDAALSRLGDMFLGLPFVLGAIVLLSTAGDEVGSVGIVVLVITALVVFGWPTFNRIMRASVISAKSQDYVLAARALGAGPVRIIRSHVLPNAVGPVLVLATISLGLYIGAEATLSFLGVGLRSPVISWGVMISDAQDYIRTGPHALLFPAGFLGVAVLSFVMLGDAIRDAFDPKLR